MVAASFLPYFSAMLMPVINNLHDVSLGSCAQRFMGLLGGTPPGDNFLINSKGISGHGTAIYRPFVQRQDTTEREI